MLKMENYLSVISSVEFVMAAFYVAKAKAHSPVALPDIKKAIISKSTNQLPHVRKD